MMIEERTVAVLIEKPELASECNWSFPVSTPWSGDHWLKLLAKQPQFAEKCDWETLSEYDWINLLAEQPQLVVNNPVFYRKCSISELRPVDFMKVVTVCPQSGEQHSWDFKVSTYSWCELLAKQPQFADKCPWDKMTDLSKEYDRDEDSYDYFDHDYLGKLFAVQPQLFQRCNQKKHLKSVLENHKENTPRTL